MENSTSRASQSVIPKTYHPASDSRATTMCSPSFPEGTSFAKLRDTLGLLPETAEELYEHLNALYMRGYLIDARDKEEP